MALYSGARKLLIPESSTQAQITPTQFILHSIIAPWTIERVQEYWMQPGINVESHFGVGYSGTVGQYVDTNVRADANVSANGRAISVETASNLEGTDKWTPEQVVAIVALMVWAHKTHAIPARICRTETDPGFGIHKLFSGWSGGGTDCPGPARTTQFYNEIFPKFLTALNPPKPTIRVADVQYGEENHSVEVTQDALIAKGFSIPAGSTAYFGDQTKAAYKAYQQSLGYTGSDADGAPGKTSLQKLLPGYTVV